MDPDGTVGPGSEQFTFSIDGHTSTTLTVHYSVDIHDIMVSKSPDRSNAIPLQDAILSGNVYIFVGPNDDIDNVLFYYDDLAMANAHHVPEDAIGYDFEQTNENVPGLPAYPFDTVNHDLTYPNHPSLSTIDGLHTMTVKITNEGGVERVITRSFTISNN